MIIESHAHARAGLLGNPSDIYFGKTISFIIRNFEARVTLETSSELTIESLAQDQNTYGSIHALVQSVSSTGYYGGIRLIKAAIKTFYDYCSSHDHRLNDQNFTVRYHTTVPRQVGLAGSSAIIIAILRALMEFYKVEIPMVILPNIALSAEKDELGIQAGLQDRVVQVYEDCLYMDFDETLFNTKQHGYYEVLDPSLLPNLYVAYVKDMGKISGNVHSDMRSRYEKGDAVIVQTLQQIARLAEEGRKVLLRGNATKLSDLIDKNFDLRAQIMHINPQNMEMIKTARDCGASAKFAGSGGSIVGTYADDSMFAGLVNRFKKMKVTVIKPSVV